MTEVPDFNTAIVRAGKSIKTKPLVDVAYGDKALSISQINDDVLASIAAAIENDRRITVGEVAAMHGLPVGTVHVILDWA